MICGLGLFLEFPMGMVMALGCSGIVYQTWIFHR